VRLHIGDDEIAAGKLGFEVAGAAATCGGVEQVECRAWLET